MPRRNAVPKYRHHKGTNQAYVYHRSIASKDCRMYLGVYNSPGSLEKYRRFLAQLSTLGDGNQMPTLGPAPTIAELVLKYADYGQERYRQTDGSVSQEYSEMVGALNILLSLFADDTAAEFGPRKLQDVRRHMVARYARSHINHTISRIKRFFKWACAEELIPADIYAKLRCVERLAFGEMGVREPEPIGPAHYESVRALVPFLSPAVGAMVQVQYLCCLRPCEACLMRPCDIDRSGDIWLYRPQSHKTSRRGKTLVKAIPKAAQAILEPFLTDREPTAYLFDPRESSAWGRAMSAARRPARTTVLTASEAKRVAREKKLQAKRAKKREPGIRYSTDSYRRAISYGLAHAAKANLRLEPFTPNQLRHAILTFVSRAFGQQRAQRYAGHAHLSTTGIYAEIEVGELVQVARQLDVAWQSVS